MINLLLMIKIIKDVNFLNSKLLLSFTLQLLIIITQTLLEGKIKNYSVLLYVQIGFIVIDFVISAIISHYCTIKTENVIYDMGFLSRELVS